MNQCPTHASLSYYFLATVDNPISTTESSSFPGAAIGAGVGVVLILIIVAIIVFICYKKRQQEEPAGRKPVNVIYIPANVSERSGGSYGGPPGAPVWQQDPNEPEYE